MKKKTPLAQLKRAKPLNMLVLTLAGIINAFGITLFLTPVNLYDSGISGTSMLLSQITPEILSLSVFLLLLNVPLFLYGLKKQGVLFTLPESASRSIFPVSVAVGSAVSCTALPFAARVILEALVAIRH